MSQNDSAAALMRHPFEFRGTGGAYFRIWIVNIALTILTLGIFSAWAKVRTRRYFNGSTWVADHAFDYHASGVKILIGRLIALGLLIAYQVSVMAAPLAGSAIWALIFLFVFPWIVNSSLRFNARNTSYRNVRFNFTATDVEAFVAYVVWPFVGIITLGLLWPLAQRVKEQFYVNNHTFGGRYFEATIPAWKMYGIFLLGLGVLIAVLIAAGGVFVTISPSLPKLGQTGQQLSAMHVAILGTLIAFYAAIFLLAPIVHAMIVNLTVRNTVFDDKHRLDSTMSPLMVAWIMITNVVLTLITLGLFYPWAKVRLARYEVNNLALIAAGNVDDYVSEVFDAQSAMGEEIGGALSFDFGL